MTDAEKEAEAERCVLFDRLNKTGRGAGAASDGCRTRFGAVRGDRGPDGPAGSGAARAGRPTDGARRRARNGAHRRRKEEAKLRAQKLAQPKPALVDAVAEQQSVKPVEHDARSETAP